MNILHANKRISAGIIAVAIALSPITLAAEGREGHDEDSQIIAITLHQLQQHQITIPYIIKAAETAGKGIAISVEVEDDEVLHPIEVTLLRDNEIIPVSCSPSTGEVIKVGSPEIIHSAISKITNKYESLKTAKVSLREAVAIAEQSEHGITYKAHVDEIDDWDCYKIQMLVNGKHVRVIVDPENGRIVSRQTRHKDHSDD